MTIAEKLIRAKADLDEVYNAGYSEGQASGGGSGGNYDEGYADGFSDGYGSGYTAGLARESLQGATFRLVQNGWTTTSGFGKFKVNGTLESTNTNTGAVATYEFTEVWLGYYGLSATTAPTAKANGLSVVTSGGAYVRYMNTSNNSSVFTFYDGVDITNQNLIEWFFTNGTLEGVDTSENLYNKGYEDGYNKGYTDGYEEGKAEGGTSGSYDEGYADGQNSVLTEFADWNLSTTSNSCTVSITNTHPSLYLHLVFYVMDITSSGEYEASVVVEPNSSYSWDSGDWYEGLSGAEWDIAVTEMRFSKDGI